MIPALGFTSKSGVEIQTMQKKVFLTGFVWIENRNFVLSWK